MRFQPPIPPVVSDQPLKTYLANLVNSLVRSFSVVPSSTEAVSSLLLVSPGGKVYSVAVQDDGTLVTAQVGTDGP